MYESTCFFIVSTNTGDPIFKNCQSERWKIIPLCFNSVVLTISEAEPLFTYLTPAGRLYIFFGKLSFRSFSHFLNWVIRGGGCCCVIRVPYVFWISIPCWMWGQWIFSSILWIALSFCSSLCCTETSQFGVVPLFIFAFIAWAFGVRSKKSLPTSAPGRFPPVFF